MRHLTIENLVAYGLAFLMIFGGEYLLRPIIHSDILRIVAVFAATLVLAPLIAITLVVVLPRSKRPGRGDEV